MHVVHVVRQFHPVVGGLEGMVASLTEALRVEANISSTVVTLDRSFQEPGRRLPPIDDFRGTRVERIGWHGSKRYPVAPQVLAHLRDADLVHVHAIDFFFDYLALTRSIHKTPLIASTHGGFFHTEYASRFKKLWFSTITRASSKQYARIIASSENDANTFSRVAPGQTVTIENGVDIAKWHDAASRTCEPTLLFVGRFARNKALPDLIKLVAKLGPSWRLLIAGVEADLSALDLQQEMQRAGVADRVELSINASDAKIRDLCSRASYVASASRFEGFGLSLVEGMSAGLTPLGNTIPPFERLIQQTGQGICVDMSSTEGAAQKIKAFHDDLCSSYLKSRAANIAASVAYGWRGRAVQFAAEYRAVLS